jgi:choline dehydrogenase
MTMAPSQLGMFARSSPDYATANVEFHVQPLSLDRFGEPLHPFPAITISVCNLRPSSSGSVHAVSPDPQAAPGIRPNYLATIEDRRVACDSIRLARRLAAAPALARYSPEELKPGARDRRRGSSEGGRRDRNDDLPSGGHGQNGPRRGSCGGGR